LEIRIVMGAHLSSSCLMIRRRVGFCSP